MDSAQKLQIRTAWRNDRHLYENICSQTGQKLITMFSPEGRMKIVHKDIWWSDEWDGTKYGRDFDFNRPFFEQFQELLKDTPLPHTMVANNENALYTNYTWNNKNCYLCFAGNFLEDGLYCYFTENSRDCTDCHFVNESELCYECAHCTNCYGVSYSLHSRNCSDSAFLEDCIGCRDCFMCWKLENQQYCYLNKQYTKEEYKKILQENPLNDPAKVQELIDFWNKERKSQPKRENQNISAENCTGNYILNSKNCKDSYLIFPNCEDCENIVGGFPGLKDSQECTFTGEDSSLMYECMASGANCYNCKFCNVVVINCSDLTYCNSCFTCKDCFGCTSLRNEQYCILNKKYSKEEYEQLVPKIIDHMKSTNEYGQFFPANISPFSYHETMANDFFPLSKDQALAKGFNWHNIPEKPPKETNENDSIKTCQTCSKKFLITNQEKKFYQKRNLTHPQNCFNCRHKRRFNLTLEGLS